MTTSFVSFGALRSKLYKAYTPQERGQLYLPVTEADFKAWGLWMPTNGVAIPWRTKGEFTMSVFFDFEAVREWCNAQISWFEFVELRN